ncbi:CotH protein [Geosporobacter subterraneus DSM 17957]|uniref:CotH protein n=1 Tax=Geosporobacter subterraneus DSM 17957 TaxID=1121919 RepID=A0A1M6KK01_9FIRM|nr:CotH kinase family protein [Geosporobacter subterraneus]SHJ59275.1 CotH protein [Geosporobacter subterraneus DSM 17957]
MHSVAGSDSDRYSFRIKLDKYVKGQTLFGLDEFVVNNMYSDPSYMREYLSYEALRKIGADVPLTVFANIYINGELFGFYLCVEAIDDSFLERNFSNDKGNLYKQEQGSTLEYVEGSNYEKSEQKSGKDETKTDLKNLIKVLNDMKLGEKGNIESVLDVDSALRYIAANTVLGNYDSYNGNLAQNYYLYGQDGKFTVIPWDYNMSIGGFGGGGGSSTTIPIDEPVTGINIKNLPMIHKLLAVQEYRERYHQYIKELVAYLEGFEERVAELSEIIRPYVKADPTKFYTMEQFEASIVYAETEAENMKNAAQNPFAKPDAAAGTAQQTNEGLAQPPQNLRPGVPPEFPEGGRPQRSMELKDLPGHKEK